MSRRIIILFASIAVMIFCLQSIKPIAIPNQDNNTLAVSTVTEHIITEKTATTTETYGVTAKSKATITQKPETSAPVSTSQNIKEPAPDFEAINTFARKAVVNILCTAKNNVFSPISGTGILINQDGLILTNAHVAQYFLLRDLYQKDFVECVIRTGSPAYPRYNAEVVYISPAWVEKNKTEIKAQNPQGTGENDFAFLRITGNIDGSDMPKFSFLPVNTTEEIPVGQPVVLVSYPAGFLGGLTILQNLNIASAVTDIQEIFTFTNDLIDVVAVGGTIISQKGASGGAVVDKNASLVGMITTSSNGNTTSSRNLNALAMAYINRMLKKEVDITFLEFLSLDSAVFSKSFQENIAPRLVRLLTDEITGNQ